MNSVTNISVRLLRQPAAFRRSMIRAGLFSSEAMLRNSVCVTAMMSAEGMPLPLTSPMQKNNRPSRTKTLYRSPPTSRAGIRHPSISTRSASCIDDMSNGSRACWILLAICSSRSVLCCCTSVSCSFRALRANRRTITISTARPISDAHRMLRCITANSLKASPSCNTFTISHFG